MTVRISPFATTAQVIPPLPTDERLALVKEGNPDNKLIEMYHNFGRYLLIAGSREKDPAYKSPRHLEQGYVACLGL